MKREYNSQVFLVGEEDELFQDLLKYLFSYNKKCEKSQYDIHIYSDDTSIVVEWIAVPYNDEITGRFEFVESGQSIMTEYTMPDGTIDLCYNEEEYKERLEEFLESEKKIGHTWLKNQFDHWYIKEEQELWEKEYLNKGEE